MGEHPVFWISLMLPRQAPTGAVSSCVPVFRKEALPEMLGPVQGGPVTSQCCQEPHSPLTPWLPLLASSPNTPSLLGNRRPDADLGFLLPALVNHVGRAPQQHVTCTRAALYKG